MVHPNVFAFVFNFINFSLGCSSVFMAEKPNVGVVIFVADNTSMCGFGSDGAAALLSACSLRQSSVCFHCLEVFF